MQSSASHAALCESWNEGLSWLWQWNFRSIVNSATVSCCAASGKEFIKKQNDQIPPLSRVLGHNQFSGVSLQEIHQTCHPKDFSGIHNDHHDGHADAKNTTMRKSVDMPA